MSSSKDELAAMYRDCDGCGEAMCTEDPEAFEASGEHSKGEHYCCKECYEEQQRFRRWVWSDE